MDTRLRTKAWSGKRSVLLMTVLLLGTLSAPAVEWNTGNDDLDELLEKIMGPIGFASAADFESASSTNPADHIEVVTSADFGENIRLVDGWEDNDDEQDDDWCMGDYFMINITKRFSYFAVCWGSEDNPGPVSIAALEVQYLGGVTLMDFPAEGMSVPGVPIPIATVFATSMAHMIEFEDTGTPDDPANTSGNGVFDFTRHGDGLTDFSLDSAEDVHAGASMNLDWDMVGGIQEWEDGNKMGWNFTLEAVDVPYDGGGWWLTANDDVLERVALTFHLGVEVDPVTDEVIPWWDTTLINNRTAEGEDDWSLVDVGEQQNLTWSGVRVGTNFKYDQMVEGWDFHSPDSMLMLESVIVRGSFTPSIVADFMDEVAGEVGAFDEEMAYDSGEEDEIVLGTDDLRGVNKISGTEVEWRHQFRKVPDKLHWVDTAEAGSSANDTTTVNVTFQLHGSEAFQAHDEKASVSLYIALGGTIFPAANHIFHDPGYSSSISIIQLGGALISGELVGLQFVVVGLLGVLGMIGTIVRRKKLKDTLEMHSDSKGGQAVPAIPNSNQIQAEQNLGYAGAIAPAAQTNTQGGMHEW